MMQLERNWNFGRTHSGVMRHTRAVRIASAGLFFLAWVLLPEPAAACEVCWGAQVDHPTIRAIGFAMLLLIGMTGIVGGGIGAFFLNVRRRSRLMEPGDLVITESGEIRDLDDDPAHGRSPT